MASKKSLPLPMLVFCAKGAVSFLDPWGIAPGIEIADRTSAESAFQSVGSCIVPSMEQMAVRTESRFQRRKLSGSDPWGVAPGCD